MRGLSSKLKKSKFLIFPTANEKHLKSASYQDLKKNLYSKQLPQIEWIYKNIQQWSLENVKHPSIFLETPLQFC